MKETKKGKRERELNPKNKIEIVSPFLSIITLNANKLSSFIKRHKVL
jgi:hypothetical protein